MHNSGFSRTFLVNKPSRAVFDAINDVRTWWSEDFTGASQNMGDEFDARFADVHFSRQRLVESIPGKKIVWLVTDSRLTFLNNQSEWTGTSIHFDLSEENGATKIVFTHEGLIPSIQCFKDCSNGWNFYLDGSLIPFINTGIANPNVLDKEVKEKSTVNK